MIYTTYRFYVKSIHVLEFIIWFEKWMRFWLLTSSLRIENAIIKFIAKSWALRLYNSKFLTVTSEGTQCFHFGNALAHFELWCPEIAKSCLLKMSISWHVWASKNIYRGIEVVEFTLNSSHFQPYMLDKMFDIVLEY